MDRQYIKNYLKIVLNGKRRMSKLNEFLIKNDDEDND